MTSSRISDPQTFIEDSENSIIKLKLKKPKSWNWELSTSKSSPNINFPKILLYDHKNNLLAETDESNCIVNDKKDGKLTNGKVAGKNKILSSSSTISSNKNETKRSPKTNIDSNCIYNSIDPIQSHSAQLQNESLSHQSKIETNSTSTSTEPLKYLGCRKRSLSVSFNEMKHFLNNLKHQLNGSGIDCKITNHSSERKYPNKIGSTNEYKHLNENFNENQLRRIKSISDINQAKKGSKQNLPESATALMYNGKVGEKGALRKSFKGKEYTGMSSSYRTTCNVENVDEHERTATETVNGTDIFENDVYLTGNQTTLKRNNFLLTKSKSSMEVVSSGGDVQRNEKKKYRRAHSTNSLRFSSSILERISEFKRRSSSTDSEDIGSNSTEHTPTKPRYFLRTSQAGTLLICNESFKNRKIRRRPRSYSKRNENGECSPGSRAVNDVIDSKERSNCGEHRDDTHFFTNGTYKRALPEESYENFDKCSNRYETAIANIDDLIAKVVSAKRTESMNGHANCKENVLVKKKSCCCNDEIPIIDEHRIENELHKNESVENVIKNRDNQLDKCINFSDSVGSEVVREKRKKRAKSLGKNGYSTNKCKNDSCGKVQKFSGKVRCRSASVGSECHSSSSSEEDLSMRNAQRGRSRVKRRRRQQNQLQGDQVLAVTNSLSLTQLDSDCKYCDSTDQKQVLLALVRRLASLQNYSHLHYSEAPHRNVDKFNPEIPNTNNREHINGSSSIGGTTIVALQNVNDSDKKRLNGLSKSTEKTNAASLIGKNEKNKEIIKQSCASGETDINMGSNVSRHSGKGLSGRRTRSSGDLCNENDEIPNGSCNTPNNKRKSENGKSNAIYEHHHHHHHHHQQQQHDENTAESCPVNTATKLMMAPLCVSKKDRNKFCGSLPNHLDADDVCGENENRPDIQLKLPINRSTFDTGCDQGYASERSPEDEVPPLFPPFRGPSYHSMHHNTQQHWDYEGRNPCDYSFITPDCCFPVQITRSERGLGLSVSGGVDTNAAFPGLIRIKRLFAHQAAWSTGMLQPGDILLDANGITLTGLTNNEALEVLRTTSSIVNLTVCRPRDEQYRKLSPPAEPPKPPQRTHPNCLPLDPLYPIQTYYNGEFEIIMVKQQGSLGFTLRKEDESVLGHYVRALVREPATTDGRIKPGDKIIAVNDVPLCPMTHEQAVIFLRQAADKVKLRLYRDDSQTPIASMSPSNNENRSICSSSSKSKVSLRPEAINLLTDLAYRQKKNGPNPESSGSGSSFRSNTTSPRRLRRGNNKSGSSGTTTSNSENEKTDSNKSYIPADYIITSQPSSSVCSDSEQSTISQCSFFVPPKNAVENPLSVTYTIPENESTEFYGEDELWKMDDESDNSDKQNRPSYLDLAGNSGSTPVVSRKPRFQFTAAANSYELNNLNNDALDAPIYNNPVLNSQPIDGDNNQNFSSLPCETFLVACKTESDLSSGNRNFNHNNPLYQSAQVQSKNNSDNLVLPKATTKSLLKWKGVMFSSDEEKETPEGDSSCAATVGTNPTPGTEKDFDFNGLTTDEDGHKILTVELNRGWNSRLGFSLQSDSNTKNTFISAIYSDSVAARDGRLKIGDQVLMVNEDSVEHMSTAKIIDLLRIIRGSICLTVLRNE
ncbi:uncharacterized protein LOC119068226 isoform X4 [Bradysia coprophila]|uniref:uncharacterized protein LOC119068226 isoform X4 n=1 Tax=Bradysia coprophila TaxID=38358 RepID=UPI00187D8235|nr:uncharacterized protein LOC119068226 isoform X4 [Bradysia coprophila]